MRIGEYIKQNLLAVQSANENSVPGNGAVEKGVACKCGHDASSVLDSRPAPGYTIRRRRQCDQCGERFTTYESTKRPDDVAIRLNNAQKAFAALLDALLPDLESSPLTTPEQNETTES